MVKPRPDGYHSVTPYLVVENVPKVIDFLKATFDAIEIERHHDDRNRIVHAEVRIGDSIVMLGQAMEGFPSMPTSLYVYVADTDATYRRGLKSGGKSLREPADQFYGDRNAGVLDGCGNKWWIATHVEDISPDELARRAKKA